MRVDTPVQALLEEARLLAVVGALGDVQHRRELPPLLPERLEPLGLPPAHRAVAPAKAVAVDLPTLLPQLATGLPVKLVRQPHQEAPKKVAPLN